MIWPLKKTFKHKMNRTSLQLLRPMILVFILLNAFFLVGKGWLIKRGADQEVLIMGNLLLFACVSYHFSHHLPEPAVKQSKCICQGHVRRVYYQILCSSSGSFYIYYDYKKKCKQTCAFQLYGAVCSLHLY